MTSNQANKHYSQLLSDVARIANEVAAVHAGNVDTEARFPHETVEALKQCRAFSAPIPVELGGAGCNMKQLAILCSTLAQACGSSAMVLAMHYIQVACLVRHGSQSTFFQSYLKGIVDKQLVLASMTSEVGTFGETRSSICAVERNDGRFTLKRMQQLVPTANTRTPFWSPAGAQPMRRAATRFSCSCVKPIAR